MQKRLKRCLVLAGFLLGIYILQTVFVLTVTNDEQPNIASNDSIILPRELNPSTANIRMAIHKYNDTNSIEPLSIVTPSRHVKVRYNFNKGWQIQTDYFEIYLYRAYYDNRETLDTNPAVRVIGVSEFMENRTLHCLLWFKGQRRPTRTNVILGHIGEGVPRHGKMFREYIYSCILPTTIDNTYISPEYVSIITSEFSTPTNLLEVKIPEIPKKKIDFGMCVSITYWNQDPYKLIEWLELLKLWGVGEVSVYNNSLVAASDAVFRYYSENGFVDYRSGELLMEDQGEYTLLLMMTPVLNDCMYRNMFRYRKLVITDFDELIVPRLPSMNNYHDLLREIDREQPRDFDYKMYWFRNVYFFLDLHPNVNRPKYLITPRYLTRITNSEYGYSIKSINDPMICIRVHNHYCWEVISKYDNGPWTVDVDTTLGMNQHYKRCHFDDYLQEPGSCKKMMQVTYFDDTMLRFRDPIDSIVRQTIAKLNMTLM
ncbi:unnamed protein product [Owenia fusiformis]|uniref:Glycosyltransferase family 92 protein n=1 Tax=Owenia fusiformis TaxID=6347 RepID=A0A8J1UCC6_OWEFU|nr:unnamed protein product [Owenia fusiformis]